MYLTVESEDDIPKGFRSLKQLWAEGYRLPQDGKPRIFDDEWSEFGLRMERIQWSFVGDIRDASSEANRRENSKGSFMLPSEADTMVRQNLACDLKSNGEIYFGPDAVRHMEDTGLIVKRWAEREATDLSRQHGKRSL